MFLQLNGCHDFSYGFWVFVCDLGTITTHATRSFFTKISEVIHNRYRLPQELAHSMYCCAKRFFVLNVICKMMLLNIMSLIETVSHTMALFVTLLAIGCLCCN